MKDERIYLFSYPGGKFFQLPILLQHMPPHDIYVEVFGGAASLLFAKPPARIEVYNDIWSDIVNLFRVIRDNGEELKVC